jgi:cyanophycinase
MLSRRTLLLGAWGAPVAGGGSPAVGPRRGALVVAGGGALGKEITERFLALAGGRNVPYVFVPTADERENPPAENFLTRAGCKEVRVLHTRDRAQANDKAFVAALRDARGVWFGGGRQWRLVDSYLGTRTEKAFRKVLDRGGVIGGTSAGATIQGSYLVRGAREGNTIMMAPGYEKGLGYLRGVAVDQHLLRRKREEDLLQVIDRHPELLGIGIDESTAIVVERDRFEVIGESKVAIYDARYRPGNGGKRYYFLAPGDRFDLAARRKL